MLLHLPIAIMAMLSPIAVSNPVPTFDIARECRFESESTADFNLCSKDETDAVRQLEREWAQFVAADKRTCIGAATVGDFTSYVDLLVCLEIAKEARGNDKPSAANGKQGELH